jgi:hypothetical protein
MTLMRLQYGWTTSWLRVFAPLWAVWMCLMGVAVGGAIYNVLHWPTGKLPAH